MTEADQTPDIVTNAKPIQRTRLQCDFNLLESLGMIILWIILTILTFGLAIFVLPYYWYKAVLNKTYLVNQNGQKVFRLKCELNIAEMIGHIVLWIIITIITFGIAIIFYYFRTLRLCLNKTVLVRE